MDRIWKPVVVVFLVSFLIAIPSCSLQGNNQNLTNQYNDLAQKYNSLVQKDNELTQKYNELAQQNNELSQQNTNLLQQNSSYQADRAQLLNQIEEYNKQLQNQLAGAIAPPYITMKNRQATFVYRDLDNQIESWSFDTDTLEANTVEGTFMRGLTISDMNQLGLSVVSQRFNNGSKYLNLGGQYTCIDCRPYIQKENFQPMAASFYSHHTDDASRIKEVWNMVTQLCPYTSEAAETPRLPLETLLFGGGDCKDLSILTASILKEMSPNWTVEFVYMDSDNPSNPDTLNHVSVFVDTGSYKTFVESTENSNISPYDNVEGYYIKVP